MARGGSSASVARDKGAGFVGEEHDHCMMQGTGSIKWHVSRVSGSRPGCIFDCPTCRFGAAIHHLGDLVAWKICLLRWGSYPVIWQYSLLRQ